MRASRRLAVAFAAGAALAAPPASAASGDELPPVQAFAVGDFNGDGTPDLAVGMPDAGSGKLREAGEVRLLSGIKGKLLHKLTGRQREEAYGGELAAVGDIDGDGATDLAVGAEFAEPQCRVDFVSGKTGKVLRSLEDPSPIGTGADLCAVGDGSGKAPVHLVVHQRFPQFWIYMDPTANPAGKGFRGGVKDPGAATAEARFVGDVDADGTEDFAITDFAEVREGRTNAGRIRVLSGMKCRSGQSDSAELLVVRGTAEMESLGLSVGPAGDWNGDGTGDLLSGTSGGADAKAPWSVRVLSGKDGTEIWRTAGEKGDYAIGNAVLSGDLDGDGKRDVAVGTPGRKAKSGAVSLLSAKDGAVLWTVAGGAGERFGEEVLAIPDADADAFPDLCVTAPGKNAGCVRFLSGKTGKVITSFNPVN